MTAAERGLLLLCCPLGEADAQVLTMAQFRTLSVRAHAQTSRPADPLRELTARDVQAVIQGVQQTVLDRTGVRLEPEIRIW